MYRALYDYKTDISNYLSFQTGDQFTILEKRHKDWFLAQNGFGQIGHIPTNYVVKDDVSENEVLQSIDRAIEVIHYDAGSKGGQYTHTQRENLRKLVEHRKNVTQSFQNPGTSSAAEESRVEPANADSQPARRSSRRAAPGPPKGDGVKKTEANKTKESSHSTQNSVGKVTQVASTQCSAKVEEKSLAVDRTDSATSPIPSPVHFKVSKTDKGQVTDHIENNHLVDLKAIPVPNNLGNELLEEIRQNTGLSYKLSGVALETVFGHVGLQIPELSDVLNKIYNTVQETCNTVEEEESSSDYDRLNTLFVELTACKDDSQQRGWALQEDEEIISNNLEELISILENAKQSVSRKAVAKDNYDFVHHLVEYYQMETRVKLRLLILRVFGAMCTLDSVVITTLLFSILTTELAHEIQQFTDEVQRITYVTLVLTMLFATGETVPANLHDHLNKEFIHFVFDTIENPPATDDEDQVPEMLVNFILAFNLHFHQSTDNLVMQVIAEKRTVKVFTEKVLLYFNRDEDPVRMFEHEPQPPDSVMKLVQDMYSREDTASVIYTNDVRVLIDIILRHLIDLSPGDKVRTAHLKLMQLYLQTSDYMEHQHRFKELNECLNRIQREEEESGDDKHMVNYILTQIPVFIIPSDN